MATVPSFTTALTNQELTAARYNAEVRDFGNFFLTGKPMVSAQASSNQTVSNTTITAVNNWTAETLDNDSMHSTSTNVSRFTCVTPGRYRITASVGWAVNGSGIRAISIRNTLAAGGFRSGGAWALPAQAITTGDMTTCWSDVMAAGDFFEVRVYQSSGGNLVLGFLNFDGGAPAVQIEWIHNA